MALPYNWDIATLDELMEYYADYEGVDLQSLPDRLEDENAPVPVRYEKYLDYNGSWIERRFYPVEALKVLLWNGDLVPSSGPTSRSCTGTPSAGRSASTGAANGCSTRTTCSNAARPGSRKRKAGIRGASG